MKIAVITAMQEEFRAVANSLGNLGKVPSANLQPVRINCNGHEFILLESGMGFDNAAGGAELLAKERPDLFVSVGFCGAIESSLQVGDVLVAEKIIIANESDFDEIPVILSGIGLTLVALQAAEGKRVYGGTFVSTSTITSKKSLKEALPGSYPNLVVEMESGAIAIVAEEHSIPMLAIRAVSDPADEELGFTLDEFCDPYMRRILPHKVLITILKKPYIIPQLMRLSLGSRIAARNITTAISSLLPLLQNASRR